MGLHLYRVSILNCTSPCFTVENPNQATDFDTVISGDRVNAMELNASKNFYFYEKEPEIFLSKNFEIQIQLIDSKNPDLTAFTFWGMIFLKAILRSLVLIRTCS